MPYNYTLLFENSISGKPMMRPLFYIDDNPALLEEIQAEEPAAEEPAEEEPMEEVMLQEGCDVDLTGESFTFYSQAGLTGALSTILGTSFVNALNDSSKSPLSRACLA